VKTLRGIVQPTAITADGVKETTSLLDPAMSDIEILVAPGRCWEVARAGLRHTSHPNPRPAQEAQRVAAMA
jgi:hypothetical protein